MSDEDYRNARPIIDPLRLFDCSLVSDGCVVVIVTRKDLVPQSSFIAQERLMSPDLDGSDDKSRYRIRVPGARERQENPHAARAVAGELCANLRIRAGGRARLGAGPAPAGAQRADIA